MPNEPTTVPDTFSPDTFSPYVRFARRNRGSSDDVLCPHTLPVTTPFPSPCLPAATRLTVRGRVRGQPDVCRPAWKLRGRESIRRLRRHRPAALGR